MIPSYIALLAAAFFGVVAAGHGPGGHGKCFANLTVTVDECCDIPMLASESVLEKCRSQFPFKREHGKDVPSARGHHPGSCIATCILTAMGGYKDAAIDPAGFKKAVDGVVKKSPNFATLIGQTIDACSVSSQVDPTFTVDPEEKVGGPACSSLPKVFVNCVYSTMFTKCPSAAWTNTKECSALKDKLNQGCPYFALRKHPKHGK